MNNFLFVTSWSIIITAIDTLTQWLLDKGMMTFCEEKCFKVCNSISITSEV
jgi:hypothetical protein